MASAAPTMRPLNCWKALLRQSRYNHSIPVRPLTTMTHSNTHLIPPPRFSPDHPITTRTTKGPKNIKTYPPPPSARLHHPEPINATNATSLLTLDPTGSRARLFSRSNPDVPHQGDILLVTFTTGSPFAGTCLSIRRRGVDTSILLRNRLLMTGVEMWVKIFSPLVKGVEVVKRAEKRARRARLFYLRKPEKDRGSVEGVVEAYLRQRRLVRSGAVGIKGAGGGVGGGMKKGR